MSMSGRTASKSAVSAAELSKKYRLITPMQTLAMLAGGAMAIGYGIASPICHGLNDRVARWILYSDRVPEQRVIDEAKVNKWSW